MRNESDTKLKQRSDTCLEEANWWHDQPARRRSDPAEGEGHPPHNSGGDPGASDGSQAPIAGTDRRKESEFESACEDPKDGELYLDRTKPGETLVEVRSDANVQIARQI